MSKLGTQLKPRAYDHYYACDGVRAEGADADDAPGATPCGFWTYSADKAYGHEAKKARRAPEEGHICCRIDLRHGEPLPEDVMRQRMLEGEWAAMRAAGQA